MPRQDLALFDGEGQYDVGAILQPPSEGIWGIPREKLEQLTGFGLDVSMNHQEARTLMRSLGYGPDGRREEIWIDGELESVEPANWVPWVAIDTRRLLDDPLSCRRTGRLGGLCRVWLSLRPAGAHEIELARYTITCR